MSGEQNNESRRIAEQDGNRVVHLNAVLKSIRDVSRLITVEKKRERLISGVCESLVRNRGYHSAFIMLYDNSGETSAKGHAMAVESIPPAIIRRDGMPHCSKTVLETSDLFILNSYNTTCDGCPLSLIHKGSSMSIRLEHAGRVLGSLTVSAPMEYAADPEEQCLFRDLACDIAHALNSIEAEEKRKQAESELLRARDELEKRVKDRTSELELLYSRLLNAQEEERKRIAADLHDGIGQSLSAVKFIVETALEQMGENKSPVSESLKTLVPMLRDASNEVRTIVMNLRPSILDDLGIIATIGWFCRQFQTVYAFIRVDERIDIRESGVPDELKIVIFRIMQEAMNNAAKHGSADKICVVLEEREGDIRLSISDNGKGFDLAELSSEPLLKGFGIPGMKERTELSGGSFGIETEPGKGCSVCVVWEKNIP